MCKAFGWSLHFSFRHTKIAVVVVAGLGTVTSLPPAAPATPQLMLPCSIAGSSHGVPAMPVPGECHQPWTRAPANHEPPSCHSHVRLNAPTHRLSSGKGRSELNVRALPNSTSDLLCQEKPKMSAKGAELPSPSMYNSLDEMQAAWEKGKRTKADQIISAIICHLPVTASSSQGEKESCSRKTKAKRVCGLHVRKRTKRLQQTPKV